MKIKVSASYSGKLPVAAYSNVNPGFFAEVEMETDGNEATVEIDKIQKGLHAICLKNFQIVAEAAKIEKIKTDMKGFRFYPVENGSYPSVTTVNDPDFKSWVGDEELRVAIAEGNILHARAAQFIATGQWVEPKSLEGVGADLLICKGRILDYWDFPEMLKKHPIKEMKNGRTVYNHIDKYAGTFDMEGIYPAGGEKGAELVPTLFDFKRTADRDKNFTQISAYSKCEGMEHIKQMGIIPMNTDTAQGFSKPIISPSIDKYFEVFQAKRKVFFETYGI